MSPIFLDADIILDVFAERRPFYENAAKLMTFIERKTIVGCTSSLIFSNLYYILRRQKGRNAAISSLRRLHGLIHTLPVDERDVSFALDSSFTDFEDAIQYHAATRHHVTHLITRNLKDYKAVDKRLLSVCTAEDYLKFREASTHSA